MINNKSDTHKHLMYIWEKNRLDSFKFWPYKDKNICSKKKMAEAGFFWTGTKAHPDSAQCFVCNKQLDGWEETDDPWAEHSKHSPNCLFVNIGKKQDEMPVKQIYDLFYEMIKNITKKHKDSKIRELNNKFEAVNEYLDSI